MRSVHTCDTYMSDLAKMPIMSEFWNLPGVDHISSEFKFPILALAPFNYYDFFEYSIGERDIYVIL